MTIEAPGTYHHSLVVANLAEAAAEAIGANATLCRVCSYFHDVGKLIKPEYFTENMSFERNPHDDLAPTMSTLIIIAHVKEGVDLALKYKLHQRIIDIIQEHHGTSLVYYFYQRALQQYEDARAGGKIMKLREDDIPDVREESFRYSGPKPQTRESAVVSLADMVESASRSLEKPTPQKIESLVNELIEERIIDRQLDECDLTLAELKVIAERFDGRIIKALESSRFFYQYACNKPSFWVDYHAKLPGSLMAVYPLGIRISGWWMLDGVGCRCCSTVPKYDYLPAGCNARGNPRCSDAERIQA